MRRLAALGGDMVSSGLRLSKAQTRRRDLLLTEAMSGKPPMELGYRHGLDPGLDIVVLRHALLDIPFDPGVRPVMEQASQATFPVTPHDLMPEYVGPALGRRLSELEQRWIESGFSLGRKDLL
jgi:poly(A) polymerase